MGTALDSTGSTVNLVFHRPKETGSVVEADSLSHLAQSPALAEQFAAKPRSPSPGEGGGPNLGQKRFLVAPAVNSVVQVRGKRGSLLLSSPFRCQLSSDRTAELTHLSPWALVRHVALTLAFEEASGQVNSMKEPLFVCESGRNWLPSAGRAPRQMWLSDCLASCAAHG